MQKDKNLIIKDLLKFFDDSPTAWHAVAEAKNKLKENGFIELHESQNWELRPSECYFVVRNGSSICAFVMPTQAPQKARVLASHSDSPSLKLKPHPEIRKSNLIICGVEIYGAPLITSWLNRDLGLAGRVVYYNSKNQLETKLVRLDQAPLIIPQLAIHLDREVNEKGLLLNKQEHLNALASIIDNSWDSSQSYIETLLKEKFDFNQVIHFDLFLFPLEPAKLLGFNGQLIAAYRIDNLASFHASLNALLHEKKALSEEIKMLISWDNEEIGSNTAQGASSTFFSQVLERILLSYNLNREDYFKILNQSLCISIDLAHALNPNYVEKHDSNHQILLGKGIVLKTNAQHRYASDHLSSIPIRIVSQDTKLNLQQFVSRNDIPCGTTIGPIQAALNGMPTVDIGCSQLSMHSCREIMSTQDHLDLCKFLQAILKTTHLPSIN